MSNQRLFNVLAAATKIPMKPSDFLALGPSDLPLEDNSILALVFSPSFEVSLVAARIDQFGAERQERDQDQYKGADAALLVLDALLSHIWELLPHASPEFRQQEGARLMRLRNAYQGMEVTRARQIAHALYQEAEQREEKEQQTWKN